VVLQPYIARGDIKVLADAIPKTGCLRAYFFTLKAIESAEGKIAAVLASKTTRRGPIQASANMISPAKSGVGQDADLPQLFVSPKARRPHDRLQAVTNEA